MTVNCLECGRMVYEDRQRACRKCKGVICSRPTCIRAHNRLAPGISADGVTGILMRCQLGLSKKDMLSLLNIVASGD